MKITDSISLVTTVRLLNDLFDSLKGNEMTGPALLHIDLMETVEELPLKIRSKCCKLEELGCNSKMIDEAIFRLKNLKELL